MKSIEINNRKLFYEIYFKEAVYGFQKCTRFYEEMETIRRRRFIFFGEWKTEVRPKILFRLPFDIETPFYTKKHIKNEIENQLALLSRRDEIKRGEII